jgi:ubiquitin-activating enzyme E1 C
LAANFFTIDPPLNGFRIYTPSSLWMFVLVAGCGGTGVEVLKLLMNKGDMQVTIIDDDRVEISNLNRQYIYSKKAIGKYKSDACKIYFKKYFNKDLHSLCKRVQDLTHEDIRKYDVIFSCLDNIEGRMHLNYIFRMTNRIFIDCGVEGLKAHVKTVSKGISCLYCIKELFQNDENINFCTLRSMENIKDRNLLLKSLIIKLKERRMNDGDYLSYLEEVKARFDDIAAKNMYAPTSLFEIEGLERSIVPNVSYINSIASSIAVNQLESFVSGKEMEFDYVFYNGDSPKPSFSKMNIKKDPNCIICNEYDTINSD